MEIELGSFPKYENVRHNAYWSKVAIDTRLRVDEDDISLYKAHLQDCYDNPTVGYLAHRKYITEKEMNYPAFARRNKNYIKRQPEIKELTKSLNERLNILYPRTKHLRKNIINENRIMLDFIEPIKKHNFLEKLLLMVARFN